MPAVSDKPRILVVEDNSAVRRMLEMLLLENGFSVLCAQDGLEGLKRVRREKPDLVILDVMLPGMDGFKVCRMIKFDKQIKDIPVIILTSRMAEEDVELGFKCGADAYVVKASQTRLLVNEIRRLLDRS